MAHVLGIDFGGTKILAGVVDTETGKVLSTAKKRTHVERGGKVVMERLLEVAKEVLYSGDADPDKVRTCGIGVAGQIDQERNLLLRAPNLPNEVLGSVIVDQVKKELNLSVHLFNDVAAAAAGEAAFGAGKNHRDFVCIFVGTGIGGSVYRDGRPYAGATNTAGELGHMVIDYDGRFCGCGGRGHLEAYASRTAIVRAILGGLRQGRQSSLSVLAPNPDPDAPRNSQIRSSALAEAVQAGDALAIEMVTDAARFMGAGLVSIVNFYNPPRIILGGGVVDVVNVYFDLASALVQQDALQVPRQSVEIVKAALGDDSGIVGAAVLTASEKATA